MRKNTGLYLDQDVVARARAAVAGLSGTAADVGNLSKLVERLLADEVCRLEAAHNDGEPFPSTGPLPRGQRPST